MNNSTYGTTEINSALSQAATRHSSLFMLASQSGAHAQRSGYTILSQYLEEADLITAARQAPVGFAQRGSRWLVGRGALTDWYQLASLRLEYDAWKRLSTSRGDILHFMWADSDLGFLDLLVGRNLCCTFHSPQTVLRQTIRHPGRLKRIGAIVLMSETQRGFFLEHGVDEKRIHVVLHGIDTEFFRPAVRSPQRHFTVISVGSYRRNFKLLKAVAERFVDVPSVRFRVVAGVGYRSLFADCPNVELLSGISDDELLAEYQSADCYLLTAADATANNALIEAMACGIPIVAEKAGGIPEYVTEGCGILVPPESAEAISEAIQNLMQSQDLRTQMSVACRERALQLDWSNTATQMRQVYASMRRQ